MNMLVLRPNLKRIHYCFFNSGYKDPVFNGSSEDYRRDKTALKNILANIKSVSTNLACGSDPDAIAVRVLFGGQYFSRPAISGVHVKEKLKELIPFAPLHIPATLEIIECCEQIFPSVPVILIFETAFFAGLPQRESLYALDVDLMENSGFRRYGFNGIYHSAACSYAISNKQNANKKTEKILSICLEPKPEIAAVIRNKPVMVTGGATPMEGIPGETTCGEIDPSIIISLVQKKGWGTEKINTLLSKQSGIYAITGKKITIDQLMCTQNHEYKLARDIIKYKILQACGAGIAAMGGLDKIVFCGRYISAGKSLAPWLIFKLVYSALKDVSDINVDFYPEKIDRIIAESAFIFLLGNRIAAECEHSENGSVF